MLKYLMKPRDFNCKTELWKIRTNPNVGDPNFGAAELPAATLRPPEPPEMMGMTQHHAKGSSGISGSCLLWW